MQDRGPLTIWIALFVGIALIAGAAVYQESFAANDEPKTRASLTEDCEEGDGEACYDIGLMWGNGKDGPADADKARDFVTRACELDVEKACEFLPMMR